MDLKKETILVVDDSGFQRAVIRELFGSHFHLLEAASGGECMGILKENTADIDLVLLDLVMPGIDGFEVLRRRQEMQDFLDIPVIVLTTSDTQEIQAEVYELGANDFLIKPIDENTALARIQNLLKSKRRVRSLIQKYTEFKVKSELDEVTGLFNKATTMHLINNILSKHSEENHALLAVDIDNFKAINDVFGHTMGDHVISVVSNVIVSQFNGPDLVGRIGGDEFVMFIRNAASKEEVYQKTNALVKIISEKNNLSIPDNVTISVGLAFSDEKVCDYETLFAKADEALYSSKHAGKSCYSEFGIQNADSQADAGVLLVMSSSRNVFSMLEFAYEAKARIRQVFSCAELERIVREEGEAVSCVYLDISDSQDNGRKLIDRLSKTWKEQVPVVVICREGSMEQMRIAVPHSLTKDILFSPLTKDTLKRRVAEHQKMKISDEPDGAEA